METRSPGLTVILLLLVACGCGKGLDDQLQSGDRTVRRNALLRIVAEQRSEPSLVAPLNSITDDTSDPELSSMASAARFVADPNEVTSLDPNVIGGLVRIAESGTVQAQANALEAIGWFVQQKVQQPSSEFRRMLIRNTIRSSDVTDVVRITTANVSNPDVNVRRAAVLTLSILMQHFMALDHESQVAIWGPQSSDPLNRAMADPDTITRGFAKISLRQPQDGDTRRASEVFQERGAAFFRVESATRDEERKP